MQKFFPGQRWISEAEPDLGLGLVIEADMRMVKVVFLAVGEERVYASAGAPLSRVAFREGETATHGEGWQFVIEQTAESDGLIAYKGNRVDTGESVAVPETQLCHNMQVNQPLDRLLTNQLDRHSAFDLRYETLRQHARLEQSPLRGLLGPRVDAIPHQLYIASEVASRPFPRVLLADEVGLGKTIEAGLILHQQMLTERTKRALIVVPKALVSQWLLELMRRFNLHAAIFDEERCAEAEASTGDNPFLSEQLAVCSLDFLADNPARAQQAADAGWDMLIVDEAHHLAWSEAAPSPEYLLIEALAQRTPGLLLLTATPEQLGVASHFARLRLLDPHRFNDLDAFIEEEQHYAAAAEAVDALLQDGPLDQAAYNSISSLHPELPALAELQDAEARQSVVQELVDRHGTGRVLFRNTRAHVQGFPPRQLHSYAVNSDEEQVDWLASWLKTHKEKVLVICADKARALAVEERLHLREGILSAAFHEDMGLLARDRAAAWFAEDLGARVLICSEIGSEGRNFQFTHHLVLLDLPENPDLLEQRIGRLDRIGQKNTIDIHIPYITSCRHEGLFRWYHEGLNAFEKTCPAAAAIRKELAEELEGQLDTPAELDPVITHARQRLQELNQALEKGRDRLLELSSFNREKAETLRAQLLERDDYTELEDYLELACESFGIDLEHHSDHTVILRPGTHYHGGFKDISDDGTTATYDRGTALSKEDHKFLSWEHPLISDAIDQVMSTSIGNAALGTVAATGLPEGTLMVECLFSVHSVAAKHLQLGRYLPPQLFRIVIDNQMRFLSKHLPYSSVRDLVGKIDRGTAKQVIETQKSLLENMIAKAQSVADKALPGVTEQAEQRLAEQLQPEIERLRYLQSVNPSVRDEEIAALSAQLDAARGAIRQARINLDAVRVLIAVK